MTVSSVNGSATAAVQSQESVQRARQDRPAGPPPVSGGPGGAAFSRMGKMLAKLESLASSDPEAFKSLTGQIAEKLAAAAGKATGREAQMLKGLAEKFATASREGTTDALRPPEPPQGGRGAQAYRQAPKADEEGGARRQPGPGDAARSAFDEIFKLAGV